MGFQGRNLIMAWGLRSLSHQRPPKSVVRAGVVVRSTNHRDQRGKHFLRGSFIVKILFSGTFLRGVRSGK